MWTSLWSSSPSQVSSDKVLCWQVQVKSQVSTSFCSGQDKVFAPQVQVKSLLSSKSQVQVESWITGTCDLNLIGKSTSLFIITGTDVSNSNCSHSTPLFCCRQFVINRQLLQHPINYWWKTVTMAIFLPA